jgi:hydrogenase nickel incorporation protein HypB
MAARIVDVRRNLLKKNDLAAAALRTMFQRTGVTVVSLVSSPGAGKTTLLERTLGELGKNRAAALVGDLATERDAARLRRSGARVRQITTGTVCHLDAAMIEASLLEWDLRGIEFLFIENVGNLVCPAAYDLGEAFRVVLLSVTEGEDKPLKYPTIFNTADATILTKTDLSEAVGFRRDELMASLTAVRPGMEVIDTSARHGTGMGAWLERLERIRQEAGGATTDVQVTPPETIQSPMPSVRIPTAPS